MRRNDGAKAVMGRWLVLESEFAFAEAGGGESS